MADIQLIQWLSNAKINRKRPRIAEISCPKGNRDQGIEIWCQNFNRKFINGRSCACAVTMWLKIALNAVRLPKFEPVNGISWSPRTIMVKDLRQRSGHAWRDFAHAHVESCVVFNTGPYTVLPDNSILITANMHPSSHQLKSYTSPLSPAWN